MDERDRRVRADRLAMIRVLEVDPELGAGLEAAELRAGLVAAVAPAFELERGRWRFFPPPERGALGALILDGIILIRITVGGRAHVELLGEGDVISPWVGAGPELSVPSMVSSLVLTRVRIALLDRRFAMRTARWPEIQAAVIGRLITRTRRIGLQAAINGIPRLEERVQATLWTLADRMGRVTREGIVLALPLTHSMLAEMIGARRPSVSMALAHLQAEEQVIRTDRGRWLLRGDPPEVLLSLARQAGLRS